MIPHGHATPVLSGIPQITLPKNLLDTPHTLMEDFENVADWTKTASLTIAADTTYFRTGTQSISMAVAGGANGWMRKPVAWDLSAAQVFRIRFFAPDSNSAACDFELFFSNAAETSYFIKTFSSQQIGWNELNILPSDFSNTGGMSWAAVERFRVKITAAPAKAATIYVDDFEVGVKARPALAVCFDDGYGAAFSKGYVYLRSRRIRATLYTSPVFVGVGLNVTVSQITDMHNGGWSIGNHCLNSTDLSGLSQADAQTELTGGQTYLDGLGLSRASRHVAYPGGLYNTGNQMAAMTVAGMLTGRTINGVNLGLPPGDNFYLPGRVLSNAISLATAQGYVNTIVTRGEVCFLVLHNLVDGAAGDATQWAYSDFQSLVTYAVGRGVVFLTINDFYSLQSGTVTIPIAI